LQRLKVVSPFFIGIFQGSRDFFAFECDMIAHMFADLCVDTRGRFHYIFN